MKLAELPHWPRLLSADLAAAYVGVSPNTFRRAVGSRWPQPIYIGNRTLWDRIALDAAVDREVNARGSTWSGRLNDVCADEACS